MSSGGRDVGDIEDPAYGDYLDEVTGATSTPLQREYERALAELMVTGQADYRGFELRSEGRADTS